MNVRYKLICKLRQKFLMRRLECYAGNGFIDWTVRFTDPEHITIGRGCVIRDRTWLVSLCGGKLFIGDHVHISRDSIIVAANKVVIGNGVTLGPRVAIYDNNHNYSDPNCSVMAQGLKASPVEIGDYAWIGINSIILPGTSIGKGAIIGAGSVVTKSIPDYKIAVGNPAKVIGDRRDKSNA